jgi:uncharacterized protein
VESIRQKVNNNNNTYMVETWAGDKHLKALVYVVLALAAVGLLAYAYHAYTEAQYVGGRFSTISVQGTSERFVRPDVASFTFSVMAEAATASAAQQKSAEASNAILAYLKEQGVEEKDIKTVGYSLNQKYEAAQNAICTSVYCPPTRQVLAGYTVDQTVSVKVRAIDNAGTLLSGVTEKGATNVSGISFTVDDPEDIQAEVRQEAIDEAEARAKELADSLGVRLGRLVSYYENGPQPLPYGGYGGAKLEMAMDAAQVAVAPGENEIVSAVSLVYEIR